MLTKKSSKSKTKSPFMIGHKFLGGIVIGAGLLLLLAILTPAISIWVYDLQHAQEIAGRKARIFAIYDSLKLSGDYKLTSQNVFGRKIVYDWDTSRTYASSRTYIRQANVDTTVAELKSKVEAAGMTFVDEPYPNAVIKQYHYKTAKNEYIRFTVSSRPRDEAFRKNSNTDVDPNQGPANVQIKVNLDDNNE